MPVTTSKEMEVYGVPDKEFKLEDFPGGPLVKNPPSNAGDILMKSGKPYINETSLRERTKNEV